MEELAEGPLRALLKLIRTLFVEAFCEYLAYWVGRLFLLAITLGNYPRAKQAEEHEGRIIFTGIMVIFSTIVLIGVYV